MSTRTYDLDSINLSDIRSLVWEAMASKWKRDGHSPVIPTYRAKYNDICISVAELAVRKGVIDRPPVPNLQPFTTEISSEGKRRIACVIWELVAEEILYIDMPQNRNTYATEFVFDITEYGEKILSAGYPVPHDPDGYLSYFKKEVSNVDSVIYTYLSESINAYNHRLYLSATISLGCASEKALLLLIDAYSMFLPTQKEYDSFLKQTKDRHIKNQFEIFWKSFAGHRGNVNKDLIDGIDFIVSGIFELLRQNRNDAGHPTGKLTPREQVFASLQLFITYCKRIYELIDFFNQNKSSISR